MDPDPFRNQWNPDPYFGNDQIPQFQQHHVPRPIDSGHPTPQNRNYGEILMDTTPQSLQYQPSRFSMMQTTSAIRPCFSERPTRPIYNVQRERGVNITPAVRFPFRSPEARQLDRCQLAYYTFSRQYQQQNMMGSPLPPQVQHACQMPTAQVQHLHQVPTPQVQHPCQAPSPQVQHPCQAPSPQVQHSRQAPSPQVQHPRQAQSPQVVSIRPRQQVHWRPPMSSSMQSDLLPGMPSSIQPALVSTISSMSPPPAADHYQLLTRQEMHQALLSQTKAPQKKGKQQYPRNPVVPVAPSVNTAVPGSYVRQAAPIPSTSGVRPKRPTTPKSPYSYDDCSSISGSDDDEKRRRDVRKKVQPVIKIQPQNIAPVPELGNPNAEQGTSSAAHAAHKKLNYKKWTTASTDTPTPSCSNAGKSTASGSRGDVRSDVSELETMVNKLRLSPYITRDEAIGRLKVLGSCEAVQKEMDDFAALISMSKIFQTQRLSGGNTGQSMPGNGSGGAGPVQRREGTSQNPENEEMEQDDESKIKAGKMRK